MSNLCLINATKLVEKFLVPNLSHDEVTNTKPFFLSKTNPAGIVNFDDKTEGYWFLYASTNRRPLQLAKQLAKRRIKTFYCSEQVFIFSEDIDGCDAREQIEQHFRMREKTRTVN